ncbi:hypothetical protein IG206_02670 [Candidatus Parvarchaeota archaeon]|nr:hypothetical protein [Candidatus Acidifodinimicrobium mancum]
MAKHPKVNSFSFASFIEYYTKGELVPRDLYDADKRVREDLKSLEYKIFKTKNPSLLSRFVKFGSSTVGRFIKFSLKESDEKKLNTLLYMIGEDFDAKQLYGFSLFTLILGVFLGIILIVFGQILAGIALIVLGIVSMPFIQSYPKREFQVRMSKASSDLVTFILYMIISMRQTSNLETAVQFAADNLSSYLAFDLKKLLWDTASRKYKNIKEALDDYSIRWAKYNPSFADSLFLIESSVYQRDEDIRLQLLDEASNRILSGTLEDMSKYAVDLKEPLNTIYMIGMVLPVLGLVLAPMITAFVSIPDFGPLLFLMYDIGLPLMVYFLIRDKLLTRPTGFAPPDINSIPNLPGIGYFFVKFGGKKRRVSALIPAILVFIPFLMMFILLIPELSTFGPSQVYISLILSVGIGVSIYTYLKLSIFQLISAREELASIQNYLASVAFQLSSFLSQGNPPESAMFKVADTMQNTPVMSFFNVTVNNIQKLGLSLKEALFNQNVGATKFFPSNMLIVVMRIFIESAQKSVNAASSAMLYISRHLSNLKKIDNDIKNLLDDVTSGMRVEVGLLSPIMAGIVVGMTALIGSVLTSLSSNISTIQASISASSGPASGASSMVPFAFSLFNLSGGAIPLYVFQMVISLYIITLSLIIGYSISMINNPNDSIDIRDKMASTLLISIILYALISVIVTFAFSAMGGSVLAATHII